MEVLGRDAAREAYRVAVETGGRRLEGLVPEALIRGDPARPGAPRHQTAHDWLAAHRGRIAAALLAREEGRAMPPAMDGVRLAEEE